MTPYDNNLFLYDPTSALENPVLHLQGVEVALPSGEFEFVEQASQNAYLIPTRSALRSRAT